MRIPNTLIGEAALALVTTGAANSVVGHDAIGYAETARLWHIIAERNADLADRARQIEALRESNLRLQRTAARCFRMGRAWDRGTHDVVPGLRRVSPAAA